MEQIEFNLLEEPWIRVLNTDGAVEEVSLTDALLRAHEFQDLAGELPAQDVAVLRLMLAVLQTVFYRMDLNGENMPLQNREDALLRWKILWGKKDEGLPKKPIQQYLDSWRERFWLFHPQRPFYQIVQAEIGTAYGAAKLNGEISESGNKLRLFATYAKEYKAAMTYAQAARWLLYVNGFDDTSAKPKGKNLPSAGAGWLGKLGILLAQGRNLAETLLLNLVLLKDGDCLWEEPQPCWELEQPRCGERTEILCPDNAAALLTLQSRRLLLHREHDLVTGYFLLGGDFFQKENAFGEQMTIWRKTQEKNHAPAFHQPARHDPSKQFWREFPTVFSQEGDIHVSGIVRWITVLQRRKYLDRKRRIYFKRVGVEYGDKDFFVKDTFCDTLAFHIQLLDEMGSACRIKVITEIQNCEKLADQVGWLAKELALSAGNEGVGQTRAAKEQFYYEIDQPFCQWLYQLEPEDDMDTAVESWRAQAKRIAYGLGRMMVEEAGTPALVGRAIEKKDKKIYYCAPKVYNRFLYRVNQIYP
ncbi:MAG: type I-E CRISPR-associated protein Cse1/CasA [Butyricicoccus pullicaecorum]|nr:type I-E CRISPR-associated protein Cse1/CasA [Butyricicoccus pullicaecorum]MDO4669446.1 type I-E CRISPR-associated protein Cse1/CasA [Butyricicoccus pullicaecorum]